MGEMCWRLRLLCNDQPPTSSMTTLYHWMFSCCSDTFYLRATLQWTLALLKSVLAVSKLWVFLQPAFLHSDLYSLLMRSEKKRHLQWNDWRTKIKVLNSVSVLQLLDKDLQLEIGSALFLTILIRRRGILYAFIPRFIIYLSLPFQWRYWRMVLVCR